MLFTITVDIDALRAAAVGRGGDSEAAVIGGFIIMGRRGQRATLEGLKFLFGGAVRAQEKQGGNKNEADDY